MIWQSVVMDGQHTDTEIAAAAARLFEVREDQILVVDDLARINEPINNAVEVICERLALPGELGSQVTFIVRKEHLIHRVTSNDRIEPLAGFCADLGVNCFLDDSTDHPYAAIYVPMDGNPRRVLLDADPLDERGEYVVLVEMPTTAA